jgi:hypothetical protein
MWRKSFCVSLICVFLTGVISQGRAAALPAQSETPPETILKDRLRHTMAGTQMEVRLKNRQKMRGRLGEMTDDAFALQTTNAGKIEMQSVAFRDVQSMRAVEPHEHISKWVPLGILIAGAAAVIGIVILVATGNAPGAGK